jgi:beta-1,4-mannosyl-glycoprotein beta-1,4-N-acetylglucosaminyltransferase
MKVFDCFTFFNEFDLLEFRLRFLDDYVDYFVIAESNLTYNGKPKAYNYQENSGRYKEWHHKIIYIPVKQYTEGLIFENDLKYDPTSSAWRLENEQRNALLLVSDKIADNDMVLVSDLDEIPDPAVFMKVNKLRLPLAFSLLFHYYYMNCQNIGESRWWKGCILSTGSQFKEITPQGLRNNRDVYPSVAKGGWHFSFLGGPEKISYKIQSFAHTEYNSDKYFNIKNIEASILKGEDILKRKGVSFKLMPLSYYPARLQRMMRNYPQFIKKVKYSPVQNFYYILRRMLKARY